MSILLSSRSLYSVSSWSPCVSTVLSLPSPESSVLPSSVCIHSTGLLASVSFPWTPNRSPEGQDVVETFCVFNVEERWRAAVGTGLLRDQGGMNTGIAWRVFLDREWVQDEDIAILNIPCQNYSMKELKRIKHGEQITFEEFLKRKRIESGQEEFQRVKKSKVAIYHVFTTCSFLFCLVQILEDNSLLLFSWKFFLHITAKDTFLHLTDVPTIFRGDRSYDLNPIVAEACKFMADAAVLVEIEDNIDILRASPKLHELLQKIAPIPDFDQLPVILKKVVQPPRYSAPIVHTITGVGVFSAYNPKRASVTFFDRTIVQMNDQNFTCTMRDGTELLLREKDSAHPLYQHFFRTYIFQLIKFLRWAFQTELERIAENQIEISNRREAYFLLYVIIMQIENALETTRRILSLRNLNKDSKSPMQFPLEKIIRDDSLALQIEKRKTMIRKLLS